MLKLLPDSGTTAGDCSHRLAKPAATVLVAIVVLTILPMVSILDVLAEQRILEAQKDGVFANLPGQGKPLVFADELFVNAEQRMVNTILRNAGFAPAEIGLRREIFQLREQLRSDTLDQARRRELQRRLALLIIELKESGQR